MLLGQVTLTVQCNLVNLLMLIAFTLLPISEKDNVLLTAEWSTGQLLDNPTATSVLFWIQLTTIKANSGPSKSAG